MLLGLPGRFRTLKKSALMRNANRSLIAILLNSEASRPHSGTPRKYCCRQGCNPVPAKVVCCTLPLFSGTQTVLVSQKETRFPVEGKFVGGVVLPAGIRGWPAGL